MNLTDNLETTVQEVPPLEKALELSVQLAYRNFYLNIPLKNGLIDGQVVVYKLRDVIYRNVSLVKYIDPKTIRKIGTFTFNQGQLQQVDINEGDYSFSWSPGQPLILSTFRGSSRFPANQQGLLNGHIFFNREAQYFHRGYELANISFSQGPNSTAEALEIINEQDVFQLHPNWVGSNLTFNLLNLASLHYLPFLASEPPVKDKTLPQHSFDLFSFQSPAGQYKAFLTVNNLTARLEEVKLGEYTNYFIITDPSAEPDLGLMGANPTKYGLYYQTPTGGQYLGRMLLDQGSFEFNLQPNPEFIGFPVEGSNNREGIDLLSDYQLFFYILSQVQSSLLIYARPVTAWYLEAKQ